MEVIIRERRRGVRDEYGMGCSKSTHRRDVQKTFGYIVIVIQRSVNFPEKDCFTFKRVLVDIILLNQQLLKKATAGFGCPVPVQVDYRAVPPKIVCTP